MQANSPGAFTLSLTIHAAVVLGIVGFGMFVAKPLAINPVVFEIVDPGNLPLGDRTELPGPPSRTPGVRFARPKVKLIKPPPETASASATATPQPAPKNRLTTYDQFQRQNSRDLSRNQQAAPRRGTATPKIDSDGITRDLQEYATKGGNGGTGGTRAQIAAIDDYARRLVAALQAAHEQPPDLTELPPPVPVSFYVAADGTISAVRLLKSSGNPAFDRSILEAFRKVRSIGPVPGGRSGSYELTFRMTED